MTLSKYLFQPHAQDCECSVCFVARLPTKPQLSHSRPCPDCVPAGQPVLENGRWYCIRAIPCAKHTPALHPPKYWIEEYSKATPQVSIAEEFPF
ncbi:lysogeny maintenance protein PflM [Azotobacter beijerinckii]|uniref:lysogeny maintenance protein PflM n=1 Tax=Azotobacter beijerinckii TaxID=170623 RepID=UPI00147CE4BB